MTAAPRDVSARECVTLILDGTWPALDLRRVQQGVAHGLTTGQGLRLDLRKVEVLSSSTVATILWARRSCASRNLPFAVVGQRGRTARVLTSCGVLEDDGGPTW